MAHDIIGDIHGHHDELIALLRLLGYSERGGTWRHPDRQALFLGDFIDRGPRQLETVTTVRSMLDAGSARAVMGNHELNAIAWFLPDPARPGDHLRSHAGAKGAKRSAQHGAFLGKVEGKPLHEELVRWFLTLPLWLELPGLRLAHACWHRRFMDALSPRLDDGRLSEELMPEAVTRPAPPLTPPAPSEAAVEPTLFDAVEAVAKGVEVPLPAGHSYLDKDGTERSDIRVAWWESTAATYRTAAMQAAGVDAGDLPDEPIPAHARLGHEGETPVFVGHYWMVGEPRLLSPKVACLDFSVAKGGKLVAYRWDGEPELDAGKFAWVR